MPIGRKQDSTYLETPPSLGTPLIPPTVHLAGDAANRKSHPPRGRGPNSYFRICSQDKGHIWGPGGDLVQRSILLLISLTPAFSVPPERKAGSPSLILDPSHPSLPLFLLASDG